MLNEDFLNLRQSINRIIDVAEKEKYSDHETFLLLQKFIKDCLAGKLGESALIN